MSAPHLTRQLLLEEKTQIADGAGGFDTVWTGLGQIWAELRPGTGRDVAGEEVTLASVGYRITVRGAARGRRRGRARGSGFGMARGSFPSSP